LELIREAALILETLIHWLHLRLGARVEPVAHWLHASLKLVKSALTTLHTHHTSAKLIHWWLLLLLILLCLFLLLGFQDCLKLKHRVIIRRSEAITIHITLLLLLHRLLALRCSTTKVKASKIICILLLWLLRPCWLSYRSTITQHVEQIHLASTAATSSRSCIVASILAFFLILFIVVRWLQVLNGINLCVLTWYELIELLTIFNLLKPLECFLHVIIDQHEAVCDIFVLNLADLVV
jgi:hypothetical protein